MGIIDRLLDPQIEAAIPGPADDFWYKPVQRESVTGLTISPEKALTLSTVFSCVQAIAQDIASMPLPIYRRLPASRTGRQGRERARNHPLYDVLHDNPNDWQTSVEFREMCIGHLLLRGNCYSEIVPGPRGFADQLIPLNPDRMKVEQLENNRLRYTYKRENGQEIIYPMEEIFHIRGLSSDGIVGMSIIGIARESIALGLATEEFGGRFFGQGSEPRGVLQMDGTLSKEAADRLKTGWERAHGGLANSNRVAVLEHGVKWQQIGISNDDSQFLETRSFQVEEVARWFGVPLGRIGHTEKATTWGTGLEQSNIWYITYTLLPWIRRWEQRILKDLILRPDIFFAEFTMEHLLRGDTTARFNAYSLAIRDGWLNRNEVREMENRNPAEGLDDYLIPQNMATIDEDGNVNPVNQTESPPSLTGGFPASPTEEEDEEEETEDPRARLLATQLAAIAVRRETVAVAKIFKKHKGNPHAIDQALDAFYIQHAEFIERDLKIPDAGVYCQRQKVRASLYETATEELLEDSSFWPINELADLALEGMNHALANT